MKLTLLKSKIHRARITMCDLDYEGSIAIDPKLCEAAHFFQYERVDIYNVNNGQRLSTYVIYGQPGEICLNGAAARLAHKGDEVIIATYTEMSPEEAAKHIPRKVFVNSKNEIKEII